MYKIRNKLTGQFSSGGRYPRWTRVGKMWHMKHHLVAHLRQVAQRDFGGNLIYKDAEIVQFVVSELPPIAIEDI